MKADAFEQAAMPCLDALYRYAIAITDHAHDAMSLVLATYRTTQDQAERTEPIDMRLALLRTARQLAAPSPYTNPLCRSLPHETEE